MTSYWGSTESAAGAVAGLPRGWWLFAGAAFIVYSLTSAGVVCSNDGAHFGTARSIVRYGSFALEDGAVFAQNDVCKDRSGRLHANRPVGTGLLFAPVYAIAKTLPRAWFPAMDTHERRWIQDVEFVSSRNLGYQTPWPDYWALHESERPQQVVCALAACGLGVLALTLAARLCRLIGASALGTLAYAGGLAFCTIQWRYSTTMFSHLPAQLFLLLQLNGLVDGAATRSARQSLCFGLAAGLGMLCEYQTLFTLPILASWFVAKAWRQPESRGRVLLSAAAGFSACALLVACDHWLRFGSPVRTPMASSVYFDYTARLDTMFGGNPLRGAYTLYFSRYTNGLCWVSWTAAVAGLGWCMIAVRAFQGKSTGTQPLALAACALITALHSGIMFFIEAPYGGGTADHRYLVYVLPLIVLPLGFVVDAGRSAIDACSGWRRWFVAGTLLAAGILVGAHDVAQMLRLQSDFMKHRAWSAATSQR